MKIEELRKMLEEELLKKKRECEYMIFGSSSKVKPLIKPEQRRGVKRTIARINTLLRENENR